MTPEQFESGLRDRVRARGFAEEADVQLVDEQLLASPTSAQLWVLRGDLILLSKGGDYSPSDGFESYRKAVQCNPEFAQAYIEIGHYLDAVQDDPGAAEPYFRRAIELGGGEAAREGLAGVLEQLAERGGAA